MALLSQEHKEWRSDRRDLARCEACEAALLKMTEHLLPAQPEPLFGKSGWLPMGMKPSKIWEQAKQAEAQRRRFHNRRLATR